MKHTVSLTDDELNYLLWCVGFAEGHARRAEGARQTFILKNSELLRNKLMSIPEDQPTTRRVSGAPTRNPHKILEGDAYESRDVACARCGLIHRHAPWPKDSPEVIHRPRCSSCGSMFTYTV
jgi:hypothetical protein